MSEDNSYNINKKVPEVKEFKVPDLKSRYKPKGWGHWNAYTRSEEYSELVPGEADITEEELAKHNKPGDMWIGLMYQNKICVFDVSNFAEYHPGGYEIIAAVAGRDATEDFRIAHAYVNPNMVMKLKKGYLVRSKHNFPNKLSPGMSMLPPVRRPPKYKPRWDWTETETTKIIELRFDLHKPIPQKLNSVTVQLRNEEILAIRIFFDMEYYNFQMKLNQYLSPILDSLECLENGDSLSLKLKNSSLETVSQLGGIIEDSLISVANLSLRHDDDGNDVVVGFLPCTVDEIRELNHDCRELVIRWPSWARVGVPLGHHIIAKVDLNEETAERPYTPIYNRFGSSEMVANLICTTLLVKKYTDGRISSYFHSLNEGERILLSLPRGTFKTPFWVDDKAAIGNDMEIVANMSVILLSAGSGITPMIRIIRSCLQSHEIKCHLVFFNKQREDIVYLEEFEMLTKDFPTRFRVSHVLSQPDSQWNGAHGRISVENCKEILDGNFLEKIFLICGPIPFNKLAAEIIRGQNVPEKFIWEFKG